MKTWFSGILKGGFLFFVTSVICISFLFADAFANIDEDFIKKVERGICGSLSGEDRRIVEKLTEKVEATKYPTTGFTVETKKFKKKVIFNNKAQAYNFLGTMLISVYRLKPALCMFLKSVENEPTNSLYLSEVAAALSVLGKADEAKVFAEEVEKIGTKHPFVLVNLASFYFYSGDKTKALSIVSKVVEKNPTPFYTHIFETMYFDSLDLDPETLTKLKDTLRKWSVDVKKRCYEMLTTSEASGKSFGIPVIQQMINTYMGNMELTDYCYYLKRLSPDLREGFIDLREQILESSRKLWDKRYDEINAEDSAFEKKLEEWGKGCMARTRGCGEVSCALVECRKLAEHYTDVLTPAVYSMINREGINALSSLPKWEVAALIYLNNHAKTVSDYFNGYKFIYAAYAYHCEMCGMLYTNSLQLLKGKRFGIQSVCTNAVAMARMCGALMRSRVPEPTPPKMPKEYESEMGKYDPNVNPDLVDLFLSKWEVCSIGDLFCFGAKNGELYAKMSFLGAVSTKVGYDPKAGKLSSVGMGMGVDYKSLVGADLSFTVSNRKGKSSVRVDAGVSAASNTFKLGSWGAVIY